MPGLFLPVSGVIRGRRVYF